MLISATCATTLSPTFLCSVGIAMAVSSGDPAPLVGHNAFLRWSAIREVSWVDSVDGERKFWSEKHVSEDFDLALRLQVLDNRQAVQGLHLTVIRTVKMSYAYFFHAFYTRITISRSPPPPSPPSPPHGATYILVMGANFFRKSFPKSNYTSLPPSQSRTSSIGMTRMVTPPIHSSRFFFLSREIDKIHQLSLVTRTGTWFSVKLVF